MLAASTTGTYIFHLYNTEKVTFCAKVITTKTEVEKIMITINIDY